MWGMLYSSGVNCFLVLLILVKGLTILHAKSIYVSNDGRDEMKCGISMDESCRSLDYTLQTVLHTNTNDDIDTVMLNGGHTSQMKYRISNATLLTRNITIIGFNNFKPVVTPTKPLQDNIYLFYSTNPSLASKIFFISLQSLQLVNMNIIKSKNTACSVSVFSCNLDWKAPNDDDSNSVFNFYSDTIIIPSSVVNIQSSSFHGNIYTIVSQSPISIVINNTVISGGGISARSELLNGSSFDLSIENSIFCNIIENNVLYISAHTRPTVKIIDSIFHNIYTRKSIIACEIKNKTEYSTKNVVIRNVTFSNCLNNDVIIRVANVSLHFTNSIIQNNTLCNAIYLQSTHATISNISIINNTIFCNNSGFSLIVEIRYGNINISLLSINNNLQTQISSNCILLYFVYAKASVDLLEMINNTVEALSAMHHANISLSRTVFTDNNVYELVNVENTTIKINDHTNVRNKYGRFGLFINNPSEFNNPVVVEIQNIFMTENIGTSVPIDIYLQSAGTTRLNNITVKAMKRADSNRFSPLVKLDIHYGELSVRQFQLDLSYLQVGALEIRIPYDDQEFKLQSLRFNTQVRCPIGSFSEFNKFEQGLENFYIAQCSYCISGTYTVKAGNLKLTKYNDDQIQGIKNSVNCNKCPDGGICDDGITTGRGNLYGFKKKNSSIIEYIPCPTQYCCSNRKECTSYNKCALHREGVLCGKCKYGYQENIFLKAKCIKTETCGNSIFYFWLFFSLSSSVIVAAVIYSDIFLSIPKKCVEFINANVACCSQAAKQNIETRTEINYAIENDSIEMLTTHAGKSDLDNLHLSAESCTDEPFSNNELIEQNKSIEAPVSDQYPADNPCHSEPHIKNRIKIQPKLNNIVEECKDDDVEKPYTFFGIFNILMSFYQIKSLLSVAQIDENNNSSNIISDIFNVDFSFVQIYTPILCPILDLDIVAKHFVKDFLFNISMPLLVLLLFIARGIIFIDKISIPGHANNESYSIYKFKDRLSIAFIKLLLLIYKNLSYFALTMIACVEINDKKVLFVQGNHQCLQIWQYGLMAFLAAWVIPFPMTLWKSYDLFVRKKITDNELLFCLTIPISLPVYLTRKKSTSCLHNVILAEHLGELLTDPYRLKGDSSNCQIFWEHWNLYQRLLLAAVATFFVIPLERSCFAILFILMYIVVYWKVHPFKHHLKILHWCEVASLVGSCYVIMVNIFNGFLFAYNISTEEEPIATLRNYFKWLDIFISPIIVLVVYFILCPIKKKIYQLYCFIKNGKN